MKYIEFYYNGEKAWVNAEHIVAALPHLDCNGRRIGYNLLLTNEIELFISEEDWETAKEKLE